MVRLVGDGVENPANAAALIEAARMFAVPCGFRDSRGLAGQLPDISTVDTDGLLGQRIVAVDNAPGAESVYRTAPAPPGASVVVGNERRGIRPDVLRAAARTVHIPMPGRGVNTLNVATAAAVALYYLLDAHGRRQARAPRPESHRPALLLAALRDHVEAGSSLRSAAAFGWPVVTVDDREKVWFGTPRPVRTEARAAARSHRNPLRVAPAGDAWSPPPGTRVVVCGPDVDGPPLHRTELTGPGTVLVVPDGDGWSAPPDAEFARVAVPGEPGRYRLLTGIVLAEAARQLGPRPAGAARPPRRGLSYGSALAHSAPEADLVLPWELLEY
ncbi:TrmH family RNA methyltransferase [Dactylosporangium sp. AC04546]|uniref:TrmH family RNA methyltransferase n=1 Tax=Dactylosporangium sp. AC04546 TaxID=2862460 RepID=UPI001EDE55B7|nr:TrmH family RNA methyltransferase [Dactylosporangium sp. AC04546]WVK81197.1 TrmH family RNA methyltransferase [Dactylosporangium sp. AC04546]